jgi:hypothetical protein
VGAVEVFQRPAAAAGLRQAESHVGQFSGFRDGDGNVHRVAAFNFAVIVSRIERGLERNVIVETLFLRIVNATRNSKGHKENRIFIIFCVKFSNAVGSLGQNL